METRWKFLNRDIQLKQIIKKRSSKELDLFIINHLIIYFHTSYLNFESNPLKIVLLILYSRHCNIILLLMSSNEEYHLLKLILFIKD